MRCNQHTYKPDITPVNFEADNFNFSPSPIYKLTSQWPLQSSLYPRKYWHSILSHWITSMTALKDFAMGRGTWDPVPRKQQK